MDAIVVGDVIRMGDWPFADAMVSRVYLSETCGWRMDLERPHMIETTGAHITIGIENVDFLPADPKVYKVIRKAPVDAPADPVF